MVLLNVNGETFRIYRVFMRAIGVWPLDRQSLRSTIIFSSTLLVEVSIILTCLMYPLAKCLPVAHQQRHAERVASSILGVLAHVGLRISVRSMIAPIEATIEDWSTITDPEERDIIQRHNRSGAFVFWAITLYIIASIIALDISSIPFVDRFLLINEQDTCASDDDSIWSQLLPVLSLFCYIFVMIPRRISVTLSWSLTMHLCGQYKILKRQFEHLLKIKEKKVSRMELRRLVDRHNLLLDLSSQLDASFSLLVTITIFFSQFFICGMSIKVVIDERGFFTMVTFRHLVIIAITTAMLCMNYHAGEYLTTCCEEIGEALAQCNWYDLSKESIIEFSIIVARCQKPAGLTAVKMYQLNHWNLKYVFNAMYSYITCIAALLKAKRG